MCDNPPASSPNWIFPFFTSPFSTFCDSNTAIIGGSRTIQAHICHREQFECAVSSTINFKDHKSIDFPLYLNTFISWHPFVREIMSHQIYFIIGLFILYLQRLSGTENVGGIKQKIVSTMDFSDVSIPAAIPSSRLNNDGSKILPSSNTVKSINNQILPTNSEKKTMGSGSSVSTTSTTSSSPPPQPSSTTTSQPSTTSQSTATQLSLHWFPDPLDDPFYATAVCNDGSPGAYYYSPSLVAEANDTFVIHLPGGGQVRQT